eukprot:jgi/Phyca11/506484/fgenesh2_kg.PHYCAscaffold_20_\
MIKAVGQGAYGCVIAASDTETGQALAIKNIPNAFNDLIDAKRILREIRLMRHLNHPNLVNLLDLLRPPTLQEFNDVYIVTDLMETDLHRVIHSNQSISDDHVQYFLYQMLVAINYVHSAEVLHRDLKPSNILVNSDCDLKLCDFGLARGIQGMDSGLTEYVVTRWYRAPELLLSSKYDKQMDVWAIGCILAEMLGRRPLFPGHDYLHPYLSMVRDRSVEKTCPTPFDFAFENTDLTKQKLQELIFEDVCAFHPDARIADPVVSSSAEVNSAPNRAHGLSRAGSTYASTAGRTSVSAAPASAPPAVSAIAASAAMPPAPASITPTSMTAPVRQTSVEEPIRSQQQPVEARPSPVVLLPPNAATAHESRASETPLDPVVSPLTPEPATVPTVASAALPPSLPPMPTVSVEPMEYVPASAPVHDRSAQAEVAIEIMQTPAHTTEIADAEAAEASLDDIGSTPIHNVSVTAAAPTVDESGATDQDAPNSTSTSSSGSDGESEVADARESEREIDVSNSPKKQVLQQPKSLLTPSSVV